MFLHHFPNLDVGGIEGEKSSPVGQMPGIKRRQMNQNGPDAQQPAGGDATKQRCGKATALTLKGQ